MTLERPTAIWLVGQWSYLVFPSSTTVVVMGQANFTLWFDLVNGAFGLRFSVRERQRPGGPHILGMS
jgi:hypothetical protein